jgi:hypothetical protein
MVTTGVEIYRLNPKPLRVKATMIICLWNDSDIDVSLPGMKALVEVIRRKPKFSAI